MLSFADVLALLWRRSLLLIAVAVVGGGVGFAAVRLLPDNYVAEAVLVLDYGVIPSIGQPQPRIPADWLVTTERDILASRAVVSRALERVGGAPSDAGGGGSPISRLRQALSGATPPPPTEQQRRAAEVEAVGRALEVTFNSNSFALIVRQQSPSPVFAQAFANALVASYMEKKEQEYRAAKTAALVALGERHDEVRSRIDGLAREATRLVREPNSLLELERLQQQLRGLQIIDRDVTLQIKEVDALRTDAGIWFVSPAVVPLRPYGGLKRIVVVVAALFPAGALAALFVIAAQIRASHAHRDDADPTIAPPLAATGAADHAEDASADDVGNAAAHPPDVDAPARRWWRRRAYPRR